MTKKNRTTRRDLTIAIAFAIGIPLSGCNVAPQNSSNLFTGMPQGATGTGLMPAAIAGQAFLSEGVVIDSDTNDQVRMLNNDPTNPAKPNPAIAQELPPKSGTLVGFIGLPQYIPSGVLKNNGDVADSYTLPDMKAGDRVRIRPVPTIKEGTKIVFSAAIYDAYGENVVDAVPKNGLEGITLSIPEDGTYILNLVATSGASKYMLTYGEKAADASPSAMSLRAGVIPGEALVKRNDARIASGTSRAEKIELPLSSFSVNDTTDAITDAIKPEDRAKWNTLLAIQSLKDSGKFEYAEPNISVELYEEDPASIDFAVNDPEYQHQWGAAMIKADRAWGLTTGNSGYAADPIIIAVLDTGIFMHPDLVDNIIQGYDFVSNKWDAGDGDGIDDDPIIPIEDANSTTSHGTHVAGIAAAKGNNYSGISGIAPDAKIMPVRVVGKDGHGSLHDIAQGILYAAGLDNDSGTLPERRADIINLSLSSITSLKSLEEAVQAARNAGVIIVTSAGNNNTSSIGYPAKYNGVLAVGSVTKDKTKSSFSNYGSLLDITAPGGEISPNDEDGIISTSGNKDGYTYEVERGTSQSTPHVSGVIALMLSVARQNGTDITPAQLDNYLLRGAMTDDLGAPGRDDTYGEGLVNAQKAVQAVIDSLGISSGPAAKLNQRSLDFRATLKSLKFSMENTGGGTLETYSIATPPWITVSEIDNNDDFSFEFEASIDRSKLMLGANAGNIAINTNGGNLSLPVKAFLVPNETFSDAGDVTATLRVIDENGNVTGILDNQTLNAQNGYMFEFNELDATNRYELIVSKDLDGDGNLCEANEPCGVYTQPVEEIGSPVLGLKIEMALN